MSLCLNPHLQDRAMIIVCIKELLGLTELIHANQLKSAWPLVRAPKTLIFVLRIEELQLCHLIIVFGVLDLLVLTTIYNFFFRNRFRPPIYFVRVVLVKIVNIIHKST